MSPLRRAEIEAGRDVPLDPVVIEAAEVQPGDHLTYFFFDVPDAEGLWSDSMELEGWGPGWVVRSLQAPGGAQLVIPRNGFDARDFVATISPCPVQGRVRVTVEKTPRAEERGDIKLRFTTKAYRDDLAAAVERSLGNQALKICTRMREAQTGEEALEALSALSRWFKP